MISLKQHVDSLNLESGKLCLEFANAADWRTGDHPEERLNDYKKLVSWAKEVGMVTETETQQLLRAASRRPNEVVAVMERTISLRTALYRIFSALAGGEAPDAADLVTLNKVLSVALSRLQLISTADGFDWEWADSEVALDQILWPVAQSAAELLTSAELIRVGRCADHSCGWLFMDMSRNRSRRWCDMGDCGNRAKARRHYERKRTVSK
jgi:predicted RNA-binding Zn ribbon-like protein